MFEIVMIDDSEVKEEIATLVLHDLPEWFGLPENTKRYIEDSKKLPFWAAYQDKNPIGFVTLIETSEDTAEIHCMGVLKAYHRSGVGTLLFNALEHYAKSKYKFLQVKTVDEGKYDEYDLTVSFYKKVGFSKLEVFPTLWDERNPCLIMVKNIS